MPKIKGEPKKKISVSLSRQTFEMLDMLMQVGNGDSYSHAIQMSVKYLHRREFPKYVPQRVGIMNQVSTPEEQGELLAKKNLSKNEALEKAKIQKQNEKLEHAKMMCTDVLKGEIVGVNCAYKTRKIYNDSIGESGGGTLPLEMLMDSSLEHEMTLNDISYMTWSKGLDDKYYADRFIEAIRTGLVTSDMYHPALLEYAKRVAEAE